MPEKIRFKVAEAEMLALLLEPLYGEHPGYGVRELIQNAVDAVREAKALDLYTPSDTEPDVRIGLNVSEEGGDFSISDRGVGMSARVLKDYFLNAGASFRSSGEWRSAFVDDKDVLQVVRTGRFGVGALAAFLIGDQIAIETKSASSALEPAYHFEAGLYDDFISVEKGNYAPGTKISIAVDNRRIGPLLDYMSTINGLFCFSDVRVLCEIRTPNDNSSIILDASPIEYDFECKTASYEKIKIGSDRRGYEQVPDFINGIAIRSLDGSNYENHISQLESFAAVPYFFGEARHLYRMYQKSFQLTDRQGIAPLNLARNQYTRHDTEVSELLTDLAFDELCGKLPDLLRSEMDYNFDGNFFFYERAAFIYNQRGMMPLDLFLLNSNNVNNIICMTSDSQVSKEIINRYPDFYFVFGPGITTDTAPTSFVGYLRQIRQSRGDVVFSSFLPREYVKSVHDLATIPVWLKGRLKEELDRHEAGPVVLTFGDLDKAISTNLLDLISDTNLDSLTYIACSSWKFGAPNWDERIESVQGQISKRWSSFFEDRGGFYSGEPIHKR